MGNEIYSEELKAHILAELEQENAFLKKAA